MLYHRESRSTSEERSPGERSLHLRRRKAIGMAQAMLMTLPFEFRSRQKPEVIVEVEALFDVVCHGPPFHPSLGVFIRHQRPYFRTGLIDFFYCLFFLRVYHFSRERVANLQWRPLTFRFSLAESDFLFIVAMHHIAVLYALYSRKWLALW